MALSTSIVNSVKLFSQRQPTQQWALFRENGLLLLFWTRAEVSRMCTSTNAVLIGMGALDDKELFVIEGSEKLALNSQTIRRKNAEKPQKAPSSPLTRLNCELECLQPLAMN